MSGALQEASSLKGVQFLSSLFDGMVIIPKWVVVILLNISKLYIESAITMYVVPKSSSLILSQIKYNNNTKCEVEQSSSHFQSTQLGLAIFVVAINDLVILMRRIGPNYDLVMCPNKLKEKYKKACSELNDLTSRQRLAVGSMVVLFALINSSCLFISSLQSQREFIKSHPNFMKVKVWGDNLGIQVLLSACLAISSTTVNIFESIYNTIQLFRNCSILFNRKLLVVLINSMVHALILRLFVLSFASENKMSAQSSFVLQGIFIFGTVGFSIMTTGLGLTMPQQNRFDQTEGFHGQSCLKVFMVVYGIMFALLQQNIGVYHLMADFYRHNDTSSALDYCDSGIKQPISLVFYLASISLAGVASYTYINYINGQVEKGVSNMVKAVGCCRKSNLWAVSNDAEKTGEMTPLVDNGAKQDGLINGVR
jgi:hypothetical protein